MEPKVMFNTSFKGFNKEDVMAYIEKLIVDHNAQCAELQTKVEQCNVALEDKTQLYDSLLKKNQEFGSPEALKQDIQQLKTEIAQWQEQQRQSDIKYAALEAQCQEAQKQLQLSAQQYQNQQESIRRLENELQEYRSQKENIGAVLMKARRDADELMLDTQKRCDQTVAEAVKYISALRRLFEKYTEQVKIEKAHILNSTDKVHQEIDHIFGYITNAQDAFEDIIGFVKPPETFTQNANKQDE